MPRVKHIEKPSHNRSELCQMFVYIYIYVRIYIYKWPLFSQCFVTLLQWTDSDLNFEELSRP